VTFAAPIQNLLDTVATCTTLNERTNCDWEGSLSIAEGELIGYGGGPQNRGAAAVDFGMIDRRVTPLDLIGPPSFYNGQEYTVCPFNYFSPENQVLYNQKLALQSFYDPLCGSIALGIVGKLQGPWFLEGTDWATAHQNETEVVGFYPEMRSSTRMVMTHFSLLLNVPTRYFEITPTGQLRRNVGDVSADGQIYCYDSFYNHPLLDNPLPGYVFVKMTSEKSMTVEEVADGACPADPSGLAFTGGAVNYVRP
jgi:hypothetical protein